jgi:hypothetical protein
MQFAGRRESCRRVAPQVRAIVPGGVDTALELAGAPTLPDTLRATRGHGVVCFSARPRQHAHRPRLPVQ